MKFSSFDGGDDAEYTYVGFMEISQIFVMQDIVFLSGNTGERIL